MFAYLAVQPTMKVSAVGGAARVEATTPMRVECVRDGDLSAKMHAKNQCKSSQGWRVLFGFYMRPCAWKKIAQTRWQRVAATGDWENTIREGLVLSAEHAQHGVVYVSTSARSSPPSPLLSAMQRLAALQHDHDRSPDARQFWELAVSGAAPLKRISVDLTRFKDSLTSPASSGRLTPLHPRVETA